MTGQKHDNDYYLGRLKKVNPALYNDVLAGKLTVNKARQMAGLGGGRNTVNELLRNWGKATAAERATFLARTGLSLSSPLPPPPVGISAFGSDGAMVDWAKRRIAEIMQRRSLSSGDLSNELGLKRLDVSVMQAVKNNHIVKTSTAAAVDQWLDKNASV